MPEPTLAVVHTIYEHNARQIPECMRDLAAKIASGELPDIRKAVCVLEDSEGRMALFFWGDIGSTEMIGLLQRAAWKASRTLDAGDIPCKVEPAI